MAPRDENQPDEDPGFNRRPRVNQIDDIDSDSDEGRESSSHVFTNFESTNFFQEI